MTQVLTVALVAAVLIAAEPIAAEAQNWKPTKPITIIVPWPAGGATDQVTRLTAKKLEPALGSTVVVVNQPGASGLDRQEERRGRPQGRLHLDRRRAQATWHLQAARTLRHRRQELAPVPHRHQCPAGQRQARRDVQGHG